MLAAVAPAQMPGYGIAGTVHTLITAIHANILDFIVSSVVRPSICLLGSPLSYR